MTDTLTGRYVTAYRPQHVEATQYGGTRRDADDIAAWVRANGGRAAVEHVDCGNYDGLYVETPEGVWQAGIGRWVVRHLDVPRFTILTDAEFRATYTEHGGTTLAEVRAVLLDISATISGALDNPANDRQAIAEMAEARVDALLALIGD